MNYDRNNDRNINLNRDRTSDLPLERLELGKLYFKVVDFEAALLSLNHGLSEARAAGDWEAWCRYVPLQLRIWGERLDFAAVKNLRREIARLEASGSLRATSPTCYALGITASYDSKVELAADFFARALTLAEDVHETAQARFGLATIKFQRRDYAACMQELAALDRALTDTLLTDLKLATGLLMTFCHRYRQEFDEAFARLAPLQLLCKSQQNLYMSLNVLFCYGTLHHEQGDLAKARQYYETVQALLAPEDLRHLARQVEDKLRALDQLASTRPTLELIDNGTRTLISPERGRVALGNQFILLALLKLLGATPGTVLSKDDLTRLLWKEEYNPLVHDNKIYVTVRRLRKMVEADGNQPFYILSVPDGYMFNPHADFKCHA